SLVVGLLSGDRWLAILYRLEQQSAPAEMVFAFPQHRRERSILSLFSLERRQLAGTAQLSGDPRAVSHAAVSESLVDHPLSFASAIGGTLRHPALAPEKERDGFGS